MNKRDSTELAMSRLRAWKSADKEIRVLFVGTENVAILSLTGRIVEVSEDLVFVAKSGQAGEVLLSISGAGFGSSGHSDDWLDVFKTRIAESGDCVEVWLRSGDRALIFEPSGNIPLVSTLVH